MVSSSNSASHKYEGTVSLDCSWKKISGRVFGGILPDDDHKEEEVQPRVQVEETHGKEQGEEQRVKERTLRRMTVMTMQMR